MTDPEQHDRYHAWFQRVSRGIAFVGPGLLVLILLLTLFSRMFGTGESSKDSLSSGMENAEASMRMEDALTTVGAPEPPR